MYSLYYIDIDIIVKCCNISVVCTIYIKEETLLSIVSTTNVIKRQLNIHYYLITYRHLKQRSFSW